VFRPKIEPMDALGPGEIGFITAQIKEVAQTMVGDTSPTPSGPAAEALPGFKEVQPVVFCGMFPVDAADFEKLRESISKLKLNDASFSFEMETSAPWLRLPLRFLGLLHLEIIQERLTANMTSTSSPPRQRGLQDPPHQGCRRGGCAHHRAPQPADMPIPTASPRSRSRGSRRPSTSPTNISGPILKLCQDRRGIQKNLTYVAGRAQLTYELPLNEVVFDFYDRLKSISRGYASFDYHQIGHREGDLVKMSILVNEELVDALSMIVHRGTAEARGRGMVERLKELIPRHMFKIPIQAAIGGKVIARETISAMRKDVTAEMLWRRREPQAQAPRQAEEGQGADAGIWVGEYPAGGVYRGVADGGGVEYLKLPRGVAGVTSEV
jgi:GTP-binding protein LepA